MAAASAIAMTTGLVRGKLAAMILGPAGVGMMGVLSQLMASLTQIFSFGLGNSAVRYLAGSEGEEKALREATVLSFSVRLTLYATFTSLIAAFPICLFTFGRLDDFPYVLAVCLAAPVAILSTALGALLQARGSTSNIAKTQMSASVVALVVGTPMICLGGTWGIVGALFATVIAPMPFLRKHFSFSFLKYESVLTPIPGARPLVRMGFALIGTIIVAQVSAYLVRIAIVQELGLVQAGYYQAAFSISGNIPAFIFAAMSTDFYPRVAAAKDSSEAMEVTSRQIKAGAILATPFFIGLILFSPYLVKFLYSEQFVDAIPLAHLMTWGVACRLVSWPLGYWLLASASPRELFWIEGFGSVSTTAMTFALIPWIGLMGTGLAFVLGSLIYGVVTLTFVYRRTGKGISIESAKWSGAATLSLVVAQVATSEALGLLGLTVAFVVISAPFFWASYRSLTQEPHA